MIEATQRTCAKGHRYRKSSNCPICPICEGQKANLFPAIGAPANRALLHEGITSLSDLTKYSESHIASLHGIGPKALRLLRANLKAHGLAFRNT